MRIDSLEFIQQQITTNGVVVVSFWETGPGNVETDQIGYFEGSAHECSHEVAKVVPLIDGPFVVKGMRQAGTTRKGGHKSASGSNVDFRWKVFGTKSQPSAAAAAVVAAAPALPGLPTDVAVSLALMKRDMEQLLERNKLLEEELYSEDEDEEEEEEEVKAPPVPPVAPPEPWKPSDYKELIVALKDVFRPQPPSNPRMNGVPVDAPAPADATEDEVKLIRAFRRAKEQQPAATQEMADHMLKHFGDDAAS